MCGCGCVCRQFILDRIVNIEKKPDYNRGSRYLLELDLLEASGHHLRLVQYIFVKRTDVWNRGAEFKLCNPYSFYWNPTATVHFIIPGKTKHNEEPDFLDCIQDAFLLRKMSCACLLLAQSKHTFYSGNQQ